MCIQTVKKTSSVKMYVMLYLPPIPADINISDIYTDTWEPISVAAVVLLDVSGCACFRIFIYRKGDLMPEDSIFPCFLGSAKRAFHELMVHAGRFAQTSWEEMAGMGEACCLLERSCHCTVPLTLNPRRENRRNA